MRTQAPIPHALPLLGLLGAVLVLLMPSYRDLHALWVDTEGHTYTHGYLILGICGWLLWRALPRVMSHGLSPDWRLLVPLAAAAAAWAVAYTASIQDAHLLLLPVIAWLAIAAAFGLKPARELLLPLGFIVFALPIWSSGNFVLQQITVWANSFLVWMSGMVAYVRGDFVQLPSGLIHVSDGCSGLHFFIVGIAIAVLYGELEKETLRRRIELVLLAAALSMVSNWLRVFAITAAGYLTDMQHYLVRVDHYKFGWFVFAGTLLIFFWIANRRAPVASAMSVPGTPAFAAQSSNVIAVGITLLVVAVFPLMAWRAAMADISRPVSLDWPDVPGAPSSPAISASATAWEPVQPGASQTGQRIYHLPSGSSVAVYRAVYAEQRQGAEMVGGGSSIFGKQNMSVEDVRIVEGGSQRWREWQVTDSGETVLIRARWEVGERSFVQPIAAQLWYGVARLFTPMTSRVMALRIPCAADCTAARAALDEAGKLLFSQPVLVVSHAGFIR